MTMATNNTSAKLIGILFILPFFFYGGGNALLSSVIEMPDYLATLPQHNLPFIAGALLMILNSLDVAVLGVLLFPILKKHSESKALGYIVARTAEAVLLAVGVVSLLCLLVIADVFSHSGISDRVVVQTLAVIAQKANYWCFQTAMMALCVGSVGFCVVLWKSNLVPVILAMMLLGGYVLLLLGVVMEFWGYNVGVLLSIPGGLCEIGFGAWVLVKGLRR